MAIREFRLADRSQLDSNGIPRDPVSQSASADGFIAQTILFSTLRSGATPDPFDIANAGTGYRVDQGGTTVTVNPASDPNTVIYISVDQGANYVKMTPGMRLELPYTFERLFIKRATNLPNTGASFELDISRTRQAKIVSEPASPGAEQVGAALTAISQVTSTRGAANATPDIPFRATRTRVIVQNSPNAGGDGVYVGTSAAVLANSGEYIAPGDIREFRTTQALYTISDGVGAAAAVLCIREEYNP